ncbi:SgcJ/EcaC family oxidoreductase [Roseateles sp. BYS87W]|uniref:SgcJ/EcaC family oxidoreductase n=1 Tax=Pelomonas baiyunensis TaxID=3299026 RepID=A0ABW7GWF1_9BURK
MSAAAAPSAASPNASSLAGVEPPVARLLQVMEDTWNASDMDAMFAVATPDIHWVNVVGMHWQGHADVKKAHAVFFDVMFRGVPLKLEAVEHVKALPGGVRLLVVRWWLGAYTTPSGEPRPASHNRMSIVAVPGDDGLRISHVANIEVNPFAARHNPV